MMSQKDVRDLIKELHRQGFETSRTSKGHIRVRKDGVTVSVFAGTPSDWRSWRNSIADLRRAGFIWPR